MRHHRTLIFTLVMVFVLLASSLPIETAFADEPVDLTEVTGEVSADGTMAPNYSGSIDLQCGQLVNAWGPLRWTTGLMPHKYPSFERYIVIFRPKRAGVHTLQTYQAYGFGGGGTGMYVTPYWSNNNGSTWNRWTGTDLSDGRTKNIALRTDHYYTIYKFEFTNHGGSANQAKYRFYCQNGPVPYARTTSE